MKKMKLKEIKSLVKYGAAKDITTWPGEDIERMALETVALSSGKYGMNGGLFQAKSGELYAVTARNSNLFRLA